MLQGVHRAVLHRIQPIDIHGQILYDIYYQLDGAPPDQVQGARLGAEVIYGDPRPGDRVLLHCVMNMVTRVEKEEG